MYRDRISCQADSIQRFVMLRFVLIVQCLMYYICLPFRTLASVPLGLAYSTMIKTIFPKLSILLSTFYFEYPAVLSRFCLVQRCGIEKGFNQR